MFGTSPHLSCGDLEQAGGVKMDPRSSFFLILRRFDLQRFRFLDCLACEDGSLHIRGPRKSRSFLSSRLRGLHGTRDDPAAAGCQSTGF